MVQINYNGKGFYTIDLFTKEREPIPVDQLPKEFNPGKRVVFDYDTPYGNQDSITFTKTVNRNQLVAECQEAYDKSKRSIPAQGNTFN